MKELLAVMRKIYEPAYFATKGTSSTPPKHVLKEEEMTPDRLYRPPQEAQEVQKVQENLELKLNYERK